MNGTVTPIVALDVGSAAAALAIVDELGPLCRFYKVGSELFTAEGPGVVAGIRDRGAAVFLDLKLHDIPNTVRGAVRSAASLGVSLLTVHASGGSAMLRSAAEAARESSDACRVFAVTILTSLDGPALSTLWARPVEDLGTEVLRLAALAVDAGLHGVVCSGHEASAVRARFGKDLELLVPGVRMPGAKVQDQVRVVSPKQAALAGATYIVLGRAVTSAESPRKAMSQVLSDLP